MSAERKLSVRGAREHNLKGVDVDIPRDALTVIAGLPIEAQQVSDMIDREPPDNRGGEVCASPRRDL